MIRALNTAATGMISQQILVDNTANNLANVNTTGFKRNLVEFQDLFYATLRQPGAEQVAGQQVPTGLQLGNGVRVAANTKIFVQGNAVNTGNPLDLEITGEGFFQVTAPDGTLRYTRDGAFNKNSSGALVTSDGFFVSPTITIPPDALQISISTDGTVSVTTAGAPNAPTVVGNITIARFPNNAGLAATGRNLFIETAASGAPVVVTPGQNGGGLIQQGFLEGSNVEPVQELVNLILAQRAFEFDSRAVQVSDSMLATTNQLIRA